MSVVMGEEGYYIDADGDPIYPSSVWTSAGHRFTDTGRAYTESCLTCGAVFEMAPDDLTDPAGAIWEYIDLTPCTRDTRQVHGEAECVDRDCNCLGDPDECIHVHECSCLFCA